MRLVVLGGGAAGFFAAIKAKTDHPDWSVLLLEKTAVLLAKVRISGGGRCNVTHACFDPKLLVQNYPRGSRELLGPFHHFQPKDTIAWFEKRGVHLKTEADGRMFPITDSSETIIQCLLREAQEQGVEIRTLQKVERIEKVQQSFHLLFADGSLLTADRLVLATGSSTQGHIFAQTLGHTIQPAVPSLFTFNVPDFPLQDLAGIAVQAVVRLPESKMEQTGPLLITHWGFSGPAALKLSAWGARALHACVYTTTLEIDWLPQYLSENILQEMKLLREEQPQAHLQTRCPFGLPKALWKRLLERTPNNSKKLAAYSNRDFAQIVQILKQDSYAVKGKTTHKEEFVTCGGVALKEVNFKTMESRLCPGLFFAGEILDIDAVTGGFNFQNAWTTGWLAGSF